jgi:hypothetical protein
MTGLASGLASVAAWGLSAAVFAQAPAPAKPTQSTPADVKPAEVKPADVTPAPSEQDAMSGPKVQISATRPSLLKATMSGTMERITQPVEEAALAIMPLTEEERTKTTEIVLKRAGEVDRGVRDSIPLLLRIQGIREEGITPDRQNAIRELDKKLPLLRDRDAYRAGIRKALSAEHATMFDAIVDEYMRAGVADATKTARAEGRKGNPFLMSVGESLRVVGVELQQSFDRIVEDGQRRVDDVITIVQPTAEQESRLREIFRAFGEQSQQKPTPAQRAQLYRDLTATLSVEQREKLWRELYGQRAKQLDEAEKK